MEGQEPTIDNLITALPLSEKVPVVALNSLLDEREKLDVEQEAELQKIHKKYMDKIRPLLERVVIKLFRLLSWSKEKIPLLQKLNSLTNTSKVERRLLPWRERSSIDIGMLHYKTVKLLSSSLRKTRKLLSIFKTFKLLRVRMIAPTSNSFSRSTLTSTKPVSFENWKLLSRKLFV